MRSAEKDRARARSRGRVRESRRVESRGHSSGLKIISDGRTNFRPAANAMRAKGEWRASAGYRRTGQHSEKCGGGVSSSSSWQKRAAARLKKKDKKKGQLATRPGDVILSCPGIPGGERHQGAATFSTSNGER